MKRTMLFLLAVFAVGGCAARSDTPIASGGSCPLVRLAEVPVEAHGSMLFVRATVSNVPVILLVDTGAERTLFTEAAVDRLHLPRDLQHATRTYGIGSPTTTWDAKLPDGLMLGGTRFPIDNITVGRFGMMHVLGVPADGLLGADVLLAFDLDLDLPDHRLTFYRAREGCPDTPPPWAEPYVGVAGIITQRDRLLVPFELDGVRGTGVLDTGAQLSSISQRMAERLGLEEGELAEDQTVMAHGAAPDQVAVPVHHFHELRVGSAVMKAPAMPVVPMTSGMGDALIGADFLRGRRVWLSFSTHRVFVTPIEHAPWIAVTQSHD
jgi:predicted aspartyl protease